MALRPSNQSRRRPAASGRRDTRGPEPAARDCFVNTLLAMTLPFLSLRAERSNLVPPIRPAQQKAPVHAVPPASALSSTALSRTARSEEHTSDSSHDQISYAVF